jgi:hypothetical protein
MCLHDEKRTPDGLQPTRHPHVATSEGFRRSVLLWVFACIPAQAIGQTTLGPLIACTQLKADTERLACFDREMKGIRKDSLQPSAHAAPTPEEEFGLSSTQVLGPAPATLHAHIVSVSRAGADRQVFVLDNAQTWQQIELDPDFAVRAGQAITISKGALGSFWLAIDSHRATRVKRILTSKSNGS